MPEDRWFKRWGRAVPFGPWSYVDVEEMTEEMEREFVAKGPKTVATEPGRALRGPTDEWKEAITHTREPPVDLVEEGDVLRVIAELPGAGKDDVELSLEGTRLSISAWTASRRYLKELELPHLFDLDEARSSFNNGILDVVLTKKRAGTSGHRINVE